MPRTGLIACALVVGVHVIAPPAAIAAAPMLIQQFQSSSHKTFIAYFGYDSGPCGGTATAPCNFRGVVKVLPGFEQAEVFLSGFAMKTALHADAIVQAAVTANKYQYDAATGALEVGVSANLVTRSGQGYAYRVTFVVVLTATGMAQFTTVSSGCGGIASCHIVRTLAGAVPAGMQYIGLATYNWNIGSASGPVVLNTLSGHIDSLAVNPTGVALDYLCVMQGARPKNRMYCEWGAKIVAFDPAEMAQNGSPIFPQYTFLSWGTTSRVLWTDMSTIPSHQPIAGFLNAFEGLTLTYQTFPYGPPLQRPIWLIESSAEKFLINPSFPDTAATEYGIFLGSTFGNGTTAQRYAYQESRAFGFLR